MSIALKIFHNVLDFSCGMLNETPLIIIYYTPFYLNFATLRILYPKIIINPLLTPAPNGPKRKLSAMPITVMSSAATKKNPMAHTVIKAAPARGSLFTL